MLARLFSGKRKNPAKEKQPLQRAEVSTGLSSNLGKNEQMVRKVFAGCGDVVFRSLTIPALGNRKGLVVLVGTLSNSDIINRDIIAGLTAQQETNKNVHTALDLISVGEAEWHSNLDEAKTQVLLGKTLLLVDGNPEALLLETRQSPTRAVEEPTQERIVQGPREGFTELLKTNLGLVRRRLPTPTLKVKFMEIGSRTATRVALLYINDVADPELLQEVETRLEAIDIDGILEPGAIGELISEKSWSPFPLQLNTERPDKVTGELLQGKVVLLSDGSNFAKIMPATFADFNHSPEDFYIHPVFATLTRTLRLFSFFIATTLTATYTAIITFHYEIIPRDFITFIAEARTGVPFVPFVEALFLELSIELIREASLRLPGPIGGTIGIVGALVLGQAVLEARLVSPMLLIVVALSFLASFSIPNFEASLPLRYLRFPLLVMGGLL